MSIDLRDEFRKKYGTDAVTRVAEGGQVEKAFVVHAASGRTVITAPVRELAMANAGFMYLAGRFVQADTPNLNGALWTTEDLELAEGTVAGGPLNWLHDENQIIGTLLQAELVANTKETAQEGIGNHIAAQAAVWRFLFPAQAHMIEKASADGELYFSMECVAREVACIDTPGRPGCGEHFSYADYDAGKVCAHLRERSSIRRMVDPIFLGGAVIVPPVKPGWAGASASVVKEAAALTEKAQLDGGHLTRAQAESLAATVLQWANRDHVPPVQNVPNGIQISPGWPGTTDHTITWNGTAMTGTATVQPPSS